MTNIHVLFLQILLGLLALSMPALGVFLSIDCGSSDSFTAPNNITWVGDDLYIKGAKDTQNCLTSQTVQSADNSPVAHQYTTRRVFSTGKKNCYSIGDVGKGNQFDGNRWATVASCTTDPVYYEVIYHTKFDNISVCVAQTDPGHQPFISAIQVISLDLGMYGGAAPNSPLFLNHRINYGGDKIVRHALEFNFTTNISASASGNGYNARYCLNRTSDSTLPPIINALETFQIGAPLTDGTDSKHVKVLSSLQKAFVQLQNWSGDPCLPNGFSWDWVECNFSETPQITALYVNLFNFPILPLIAFLLFISHLSSSLILDFLLNLFKSKVIKLYLFIFF
uniref:Malectin-like domain-containing protein n=1 Tax=Nelumbo nucifera TaxID=4432 RepID=A0A822ZDD1_NELNU|nr:TPA_asm: hypothetical protein HUJ06_000803 [Nelumbo nucifera]